MSRAFIAAARLVTRRHNSQAPVFDEALKLLAPLVAPTADPAAAASIGEPPEESLGERKCALAAWSKEASARWPWKMARSPAHAA